MKDFYSLVTIGGSEFVIVAGCIGKKLKHHVKEHPLFEFSLFSVIFTVSQWTTCVRVVWDYGPACSLHLYREYLLI